MKLKYDKLLSNFAFNFNLRHYNSGEDEMDQKWDLDPNGGMVQDDPALTPD